MDIQKAINILNKEYPGRKAIGYWLDGNNCVINTLSSRGMAESSQFIVQENGEVIPTNPIRCDIIEPSTMIRL